MELHYTPKKTPPPPPISNAVDENAYTLNHTNLNRFGIESGIQGKMSTTPIRNSEKVMKLNHHQKVVTHMTRNQTDMQIC